MQHFNRHQIFTIADLKTVRGLIEQAMDRSDWGLHNMLCGLYDGVLYPELLGMAELRSIINKINQGL